MTARDTGGLREAAQDVVIQEGRYYERDGSGESKVLAVVPKAALDALRAALSQGAAHEERGLDDNWCVATCALNAEPHAHLTAKGMK